MTIGNHILNLLYQRGISQKQLAIDLNIPPSTLNGYINNRREPDYATLIRFARYFHVSCDYLIGNTSANASEPLSSDTPSVSFALDNQDIKLLSYCKTLTQNQMELVMSQVKLMHEQNTRTFPANDVAEE